MSSIIAQFKLKMNDNGFGLDVDLQMPGHGISVIYGRSGSGKTTLLRSIAGLERAADGHVIVNEHVWQSTEKFTPTHKRQVGFIFQQASLFSHMSVDKNLAYAQRRAAKNGGFIDKQQVVELMGIESLLNHHPAQLSGGESQRVALARALLNNPKLLLMDEPLASLDYERKQDILPFLERLRDEFNLPIIYVTHSMDEVTRLADHLVILDDGKVVAQGELSEILPRLDLPLQLGDETGVVIAGEITKRDEAWHLACVRIDGGELWIADEKDMLQQKVRIRILARDVSLSLQPNKSDNSILNSLAAEIMNIVPDKHPAMCMVQIKLGAHLILARVTAKSVAQLALKIGDKVWANVKSVSVMR